MKKLDTLKKVNWKFPCKGISVIDNIIVGFSSYGRGVVLDAGNSTCHKLYEFSEYWIMTDFVPIEEEKQPVDWDKVELPVWAKNRFGNLIQIKSIKGENVQYWAICGSKEMVVITDIFPTQGFAKQWLNSLEILPKGTKIEITI